MCDGRTAFRRSRNCAGLQCLVEDQISVFPGAFQAHWTGRGKGQLGVRMKALGMLYWYLSAAQGPGKHPHGFEMRQKAQRPLYGKAVTDLLLRQRLWPFWARLALPARLFFVAFATGAEHGQTALFVVVNDATLVAFDLATVLRQEAQARAPVLIDEVLLVHHAVNVVPGQDFFEVAFTEIASMSSRYAPQPPARCGS